jgi:hypothetical protein
MVIHYGFNVKIRIKIQINQIPADQVSILDEIDSHSE